MYLATKNIYEMESPYHVSFIVETGLTWFNGYLTMLDVVSRAETLGQNRRRHPRVPAAIRCRVATPEGFELDCRTIDISATSLALNVNNLAAIGARILAYVDGIGRVEGRVVRTSPKLTALAFDLDPRKQMRLSRQIEALRTRAIFDQNQRSSREVKADPSMHRFCQNLEIVVQNLIREPLLAERAA